MSDLEPDAEASTPEPPAPEPPAPEPSALAPLFANAALALVVLAGLELLLTVALGLSVKVQGLGRVSQIGYAFLSQLDKSPLALLLVIAAIVSAAASRWASPNSQAESRAGLTAGLVIGFAVLLAIGTVLGLVVRFELADLPGAQKVGPDTQRVLAIFIVRNLGAAAVALAVASSAMRLQPQVGRARRLGRQGAAT